MSKENQKEFKIITIWVCTTKRQADSLNMCILEQLGPQCLIQGHLWTKMWTAGSQTAKPVDDPLCLSHNCHICILLHVHKVLIKLVQKSIQRNI